MVKEANAIGLNCYVDWSADNVFLKRSMVSDYTKEVLKKRMEQSKCLLYLSSDNSRNSEWVLFELDYYENFVKRKLLMMKIEGEDLHEYECINLDDIKKS